jgi:hypothetical protein
MNDAIQEAEDSVAESVGAGKNATVYQNFRSAKTHTLFFLPRANA